MNLLNSIDEIKLHNSAISNQLDLENLQSYIDDAINQKIVPAIGHSQFVDLENLRDSGTNPKQARLIQLLQKAIVGFMIFNWADQGAVEFSNLGIHVAKSDKKLPASDKKIISLKKQNVQAGFFNLEMAITFLEENIDDFPIYKVGSEHLENRSLLINTSAEFQRSGVNINNDPRLYQTLRVYQSGMESTFIEPLLGFTIKESLHTGILNNSLDQIHRELLRRVQKAVAYYTIYDAIPFMAISIDSSGIFQLSDSVGGISGNVENRSAATDRSLARAMSSYYQKAEQEVERIRKYLIVNKHQFTYTVPNEVKINDGESNTYFF